MKRTKSPRDVCSRHSRRLRLEILERRCLLAVDFVAFNDHLPAGGTHANATSYGTNSGATASGFLKDIDTGLDTPIVLSISSSGPNFAGSSSQPHFSTDAGQIFNGYVDFTSQNGQSIEIQGSQGDFYSHQFAGLNPDRDYEFVGTTVRGNSPYTDRWTLVTLVGADDFTAAHSSGIGVVTDGLAANQVAIWVGHNSLSTQGFVAQWQEIDPGDDGIFEVVSTQYKGPTPGVGSGDSSGGSKGYGLAGIRLIQNVEPTIPAVGNVAAADVSALSAIIGGVVTDTGRQDPDVTLYWGDNDAGTVAGNWDNAVDLGEHSGIFATALSGLDPLSTYYWRSHVENSAGEAWASSTSQFTTLPLTLPSVINTPVTDLLPFSAVANGEVVDAGGDTPAVVIYYGTSDGGTDSGAWDAASAIGFGVGPFAEQLTNLTQSTQYFYRAEATNAAGTAWAPSTTSFTTPTVTLPILNGIPATSIGAFSADLGGELIDGGGDPPIATIFYGTVDGGTDPSSWTHELDAGQVFGAYNETANSLTPETTYYFTSRAVNAAGEVWTSTQSFTTLVAPTLRISEFLASNEATLLTRVRDSVGDPFGDVLNPDWIEIENLSLNDIDLGGVYLTDDDSNPLKWAFPTGKVIPAGGFLVVFASNLAITDSALDELGYLHTNFKLSSGGERIAIHSDDGLATEIDAFETYPQQFEDISYGIGADLLPHYYSTPSPGAANSGGVVNYVEDTKFSVDRGFYTDAFDVEISSDTIGAAIYYTLNGDEPTDTASATNILYTTAIHVDATTTLKAKAFLAGFEPTNSDTQTYIFVDDVVQQTYQSTIDAGFPSSWRGTSPDYGLDSDVIGPGDLFGGIYANTIRDDLQSIPSLSIVLNIDDMFGNTSQSIYANPTNSNNEVATSIELINPDGSEGFQVNAGIKIQGGAFRNFSLSKKKSLRLKFKSEYGPSKLKFPFFGDDAVDEFDTITLRMEANDGWQWSGANSQPQYARDQFGRDSMRDMGQPASHGNHMHVYINGVYWGMYNPVERPDASFGESYIGGDKDNWDVQNAGKWVAGNGTEWSQATSLTAAVQLATNETLARAAYQKVQGNLPDGTNDPTQQDYVDLDNLIDYLMVNWYGGNSDWPSHNFYFGRERGADSTGFKFFMWDSEWSLFLRSNTGTNRLNVTGGPLVPHTNLRDYVDYKLLFADHVQREFLEPGGAFWVNPDNPNWDPLNPQDNVPAARYAAITDEIASPLVGESARWGDQHKSTPYTVQASWDVERQRLMDDWFPVRSAIMVGQFQGGGLYPSFFAPEYHVAGVRRHGGVLTAGETVSLVVSEPGTVYYTLDGSDPRTVDGNIAAGALAYSSSLTLTESASMSARLLTTGGEWSAITETEFFVNPLATVGDLEIREINYHPSFPTAEEIALQQALDPNAGTGDADDFEFIELINTSGHTVNLFGTSFREVGGEGVDFTFGDKTLADGERIVVVENAAAFEARYSSSINVAGVWSGGLDNGGERLSLFTHDDSLMLEFDFDDTGSWPGRADGNGSSLELFNVTGDLNLGSNWQSSIDYGGSPGTAGRAADERVVINEVFAHTDLPDVDAVELYNSTGGEVDISGWFLSDSNANYFKYAIPANTKIGSGAYRIFDETDFNPGLGTLPNDFSFSSFGDEVWLVAVDSNTGKPTHFVDRVKFQATLNGVSLGRLPDGDAGANVVPLAETSLGSANLAHRVGELIISEVHYNPDGPDEGLEFLEIYNTTTAPIDLGLWRINNAVDFDLPAGVVVASESSVVLVGFDPTIDTIVADTFRSTYGIDGSVLLVGPWQATDALNDGGETIDLEIRNDELKPGETEFDYILIDRVDYNNNSPWPTTPGGSGDSLQRNAPTAYGNEASNWFADQPTPGSGFLATAPLDFNEDGTVDASTDGNQILVVLFGLPDANLAAFRGVTPLTNAEIAANIQQLRDNLVLDVNEDGAVDASTDGNLILVVLFGLPEANLTPFRGSSSLTNAQILQKIQQLTVVPSSAPLVPQSVSDDSASLYFSQQVAAEPQSLQEPLKSDSDEEELLEEDDVASFVPAPELVLPPVSDPAYESTIDELAADVSSLWEDDLDELWWEEE